MKKQLPIILITLTGLLLRLWNFTSISLWHDEAFSALLIKYPFSEMMHRIGLDVHPPMYYIFLRFWDVFFGNSLASLRGFSVFFGVATIFVTYLFVKAAFKNTKAANIAALLVAVNPFQIQYVSEARMYTFGAFLAILGAYFLTKALQEKTAKEQSKGNVLYYLLFSATVGLMVLTHYYLLFTGAALCLYALIWHIYKYKLNYKAYGSLLLSYIFIVLAFIPYLPTFLYQFKQVGDGYWIPKIDKWSIPTTLWQMLVGIGVDIQKTKTQVLVSIAAVVTIFLIVQFLRKQKEFQKWLVSLAFIAPFAGSILFALLSMIQGKNSSVYLVRYFLYSSTFLSIIIALWLVNFKSISKAKIIASAYVLLCLVSTWHFWDELKPKERPGMDSAAKYLKANVQKEDKIIVGSSFEFFNYKYYNSLKSTETNVQPLLFSGGTTDIKSMPHYAGTAILTNEDLFPDFNKGTKNGDTVWLLWTNGFGGSKPTVPTNFRQIGEEKVYPEIRPYIGTNIYVTQYKVN